MEKPDQTSDANYEEDVQRRTGGKFSAEDIRNFAAMCAKHSKIPVLGLVAKMLIAEGKKSTADLLTALFSGERTFSQSIDVPKEYAKISHSVTLKSLNTWLGHGPKDYVAEVEAPEAMAANIYESYNSLKLAARAFWAQFKLDNKSLADEIISILGPDMEELKIDQKSPTTLYFKEDFGERVVIMVAYCKTDGTLYMKK